MHLAPKIHEAEVVEVKSSSQRVTKLHPWPRKGNLRIELSVENELKETFYDI